MKARPLPWCVPLGVLALLLTGGANYLLGDPPAANSGFTPDKGKLRILQQGNEAGTEEFSFAPSGNGWILDHHSVLHVPGSPQIRTSGQLPISAHPRPKHS